MTKNEIMTKVSKNVNVDVNTCHVVLNSFIEELKDCLAEGGNLIIKGFMGFEVVERPERVGRHPQTGDVVTFPPAKVIKCKMSRMFKDAVNGK